MKRFVTLTAVVAASLSATPSYAQPPVSGPGRGGFRPQNPLVSALDKDGDGEISGKELEQASAVLTTLDKNKDGELTPDELRPSFGGRPGFGPSSGGRSGGPGSSGSGTLERAGLEVGRPMPNVTIFDAKGQPFEMAGLKGKYTVLVFGCLT